MRVQNCRIIDIHRNTLALWDAEGRYSVRTNMADHSTTVTRIDYRGEVPVLYVRSLDTAEAKEIHAELAFDVCWELALDRHPNFDPDTLN